MGFNSVLKGLTLAGLQIIQYCISPYNQGTWGKNRKMSSLDGCLTVHLPHEIIWNANLTQQGNFITVFLARHISGTYAHHQEHWIFSRMASSAPYTRPTQRLSRPPPIQKLGAENHMLQLNIQCSWWWAYVPETCRAKNTVIKLPCCIKLAFQLFHEEDARSNNPQVVRYW